jgi:hypothetical protein
MNTQGSSDAEIKSESANTALSTGRYTGERLAKEKPEIYQAIVRMLAAGMSIRQIQRFLNVHHRTVAAVEEREMPAVDAFRTKLTTRVAVALKAVTDELTDSILEDKMKPGELSYAFGTLFDRYQLLTGGATVRIENVQVEDVHAQLEKYLDELPEADVKMIEGALQTGLPQENPALLPVADSPQTSSK